MRNPCNNLQFKIEQKEFGDQCRKGVWLDYSGFFCKWWYWKDIWV